VVLVDPAQPVESYGVRGHDVVRLREFVAALAPDHKVRAVFRSQTPDPNGPIRHLERLTALNAAGKPDGQELDYVDWYRNAVRVAHYRNGVLHGVEKRFSVGEKALESETPWEDGKINGIRRTFHDNGKVASESVYVRNVLTGASRSFNENGAVVRTVNYVDGVRDGESVDYWPEKPAQVERVVPYRKGVVHGAAKAYYLSGQLKWERPFRDNRQHGVEKQYTADGKIEKTVYWLDGRSVTEDEYRKQAGR
jgi:antitoxin component YwqK of YwqJK toxin-antitoxin module